MGRMPGRVLLAGWPDVDEEMEEVELWAPEKVELWAPEEVELWAPEEVELWAPEEAEGPDISGSSEEEDRPGLFFVCFSFVSGGERVFFPFSVVSAVSGKENRDALL